MIIIKTQLLEKHNWSEMEIGNEGNEMTSGNKGYILKRNKSSFNLLSTTDVLTENLVNIVWKFCF